MCVIKDLHSFLLQNSHCLLLDHVLGSDNQRSMFIWLFVC